MTENLTISDRIRQLAAELPRGWQADLARYCGVQPPSVNGWLHGNSKRMEACHLFLVADFFKVSARWLAFGTGPKRPGEEDKAPIPHVVRPAPPVTISVALNTLGAALAAHNQRTRDTAGDMLANFAHDPEHGGNIRRALIVLLAQEDEDEGDDPSQNLNGTDNSRWPFVKPTRKVKRSPRPRRGRSSAD